MKPYLLLLPFCLFLTSSLSHADDDNGGWTTPVLPTPTPTPLPSPHIDPPPNPQCHDDCPRTSMKRQDQVDRPDDMQKLLHNGDFFKPKGAGYDYQNPDRLRSGIGGNAGGGGY